MYDGGVTGYFGEKTREAVRKYQKENGIVGGGDERTTGWGMIGEKTRGHFARNCEIKKDIYTIKNIKEIVVTTNSKNESANVAVDMSTTTDIAFKIGSTTRAKMQSAIGLRLDESYQFKFGTTTRKDGRYDVLTPLLKWKHEATATATSSCKGGLFDGLRCGKAYGLTDVSQIVFEHHKRGGEDATTTRYTVTLTDKSVRTFVKKDAATAPFSEEFTKAVRKTGYTGDIAALLAKATVKVGKFSLEDVATVVIDSTAAAHDGPFKYLITLKNGGKVKVEACSFCVEGSSDKAFRKAGYTGDIAALKAKATAGTVLGVATSSAEALFEKINNDLDVLMGLIVTP
jgi:hypothetical protein